MADILPPKVTKKSVVEGIHTRQDFNKVVDTLQRFTKRGVEKPVELKEGVRVTLFEKHLLDENLKAFNNKVKYHRNKHPTDRDMYPETKTYEDVLDTVKTRKDIAYVNQSLQRFLEPDSTTIVKSKSGARATKWEVEEFYHNQEVENEKRRQRKKELDEKEVTLGGKPTGSKRKEMGSIKENDIKELHKNYDNMSMQEWKKAKMLYEQRLKESYNQRKKEVMLSNYIKGLIHEGYSESLQNYMLTIPLDKFIEIVDTDEIATFDFIYDPQELKNKESRLWDLWEQHSTGKNENPNITIEGILYDDING